MDVIELLGRALRQTGTIVDGVRADQMGLATPCAEWDVRTIIGHLVRGNETSAAVAEGRSGSRIPSLMWVMTRRGRTTGRRRR